MSTPRQIRHAQLTGVAIGFAAGHRDDLTDVGAAVAEMHAITTDPVELAEAAAAYADTRGEFRHWAADRAVEVLIAAGAPRQLVDELAVTRRPPLGLGSWGTNEGQFRKR